MRWLLIVGIAALVCLGTATVAYSDNSGTATIPGCAPQCLRPSLIEPGNLRAGKYQTKNFFAGAMTLSFAKGWFSGEDSTGEFWASPKSNQTARVLFWEDVYAAKPSTPGTWRRVGPLMADECKSPGLAPEEPELDGLQAEERQDRHDPRSRRRHRCLG